MLSTVLLDTTERDPIRKLRTNQSNEQKNVPGEVWLNLSRLDPKDNDDDCLATSIHTLLNIQVVTHLQKVEK